MIKELKKYPGNLEVFYAHNDNREYEIAGDTLYLMLLDKSGIDINDIPDLDRDRDNFESLPDKMVIIRG